MIAAVFAAAVVLESDAGSLLEVLGSVASLGVVASLGRSLGSGTVVSEAVVSETVVSEVPASLELAVPAGVEGVTARGLSGSGVLTAAGGCGVLSEALGTRIGTACIGSKATLSWLLV